MAKHPSFHLYQADPPNGGPPVAVLGQSYVTPQPLFFVRSHAPTPVVDPTSYKLQVTGQIQCPLAFSLEELRSLFPERKLVATVQCAGNRRQELLPYGDIQGELHWAEEAIGTAQWGGIALSDVLAAAGITESVQHVEFRSLDSVPERGGSAFGGSIPLAKAMEAEVLLAWEMNGAPLPPEHGFPLRVVVPGYLGARSVKWLGSIFAGAEPSDNYYQRHAYRLFASDATAKTADWDNALMLGEMPLTSVICTPTSAATVTSPVAVTGYALASGGRSLARVEVTADGGQHWVQATLAPPADLWAWQLWQMSLALLPGDYELAVRAWDSSATTQPERIASVWNFKGYCNNAWHHIRCRVE